MKRLPLVAATAAALALGLAPSVAASNFPARIDLPNGWQPEGITSGPGTTFYVGSLANGAIFKGDLRTGTGDVFVPGSTGLVGVGTEYEASAGRLWVAGGPTGAVRAYDARTGELLGSWQFSAGFLNDLVATPNAIYVTDSLIAQLIVIPLGPGGALPGPSGGTTIPISGDLQYVAGFNANGIVEARGELIVVQSNTGRLFTVDPATGDTDQIDLGGATVMNGDGMEVLGNKLFVVENFDNRIAVLKLGPRLESGQLLGTISNPDFDVPTTVTYAAGHLWAVNARFSTPPTASTPYWITRVP